MISCKLRTFYAKRGERAVSLEACHLQNPDGGTSRPIDKTLVIDLTSHVRAGYAHKPRKRETYLSIIIQVYLIFKLLLSYRSVPTSSIAQLTSNTFLCLITLDPLHCIALARVAPIVRKHFTLLDFKRDVAEKPDLDLRGRRVANDAGRGRPSKLCPVCLAKTFRRRVRLTRPATTPAPYRGRFRSCR